MKMRNLWKKRLLCVAIAIALVVTLLPAAVFAADGAQEAPNAEAQPTAAASEEAQPTAMASTEPTASASVEPSAAPTVSAEPTASASAQPSASAEALPAPAAAQANNGVSPLAAGMDDFVIQYYDENGNVVPNVTLPHPITMKLEDGSGNIVSTADYDITWYRQAAEDSEEIGTGDTLAFPYTSMSHMGSYPIIAIVTEKSSGDERTIDAKKDYAQYGGIMSLIVAHQPVYAGDTVNGVTLSADGKTVTLSGAAIHDDKEDIWVNSCILVETRETEVNLEIVGENDITSQKNDGVVIDMENKNQDSKLNITGGGELNVDLKCSDESELRPFIAGGVYEAKQNVAIDGGTVLNLKAESMVDNLFSGNAFSVGPYASLRIDDGAINAETDGGRVIDIAGQEEDSTFYVGPKGSISAISNCAQTPPQGYGSTDISGINFSGGEAVIDGGRVDILMKQQMSSSISGYFATHASTTIKNGATLKSVIAKLGETGDVEALYAIVGINFIVDNATVDAIVQTEKDSGTSGWGIAFADTLAIRSGSNVTVNMDGGMYTGIKFGGDINKADEGMGTVFVKNSNLTVNGATEYVRMDDEMVNHPDGIEACFLKTEISNDDYAVTVSTSSPANDSIAVFMQKPNTEQKAEFNMFYLPERLQLGGLDGIITPENGVANLYGYKEMPDDSMYVSAEVIYGADKTKPAQDVVISRYDYVFEELTSADGKISVTGNIDRSAQLTVTTDLHANCAVCDEMRKLNGAKDKAMIFLGDIALTGVPNPYKGELGLTFTVDAKYNGKTVSLMHCVNGKAELQTAVMNGGKVQFAVTSLSPFALYVEGTPSPSPSPKTGDNADMAPYIWLLVIAAGAAVTTLIIRRKKVRSAK